MCVNGQARQLCSCGGRTLLFICVISVVVNLVTLLRGARLIKLFIN